MGLQLVHGLAVTTMLISRMGATVALTTTLVLAASGLPAAAAPQPSPSKAAAGKQAPLADPGKTLGGKWRTSSDVMITGAGDTDGYHLYIAREADAFAWTTLATLKSSDLDFGPWGGAVCVTGTGRYAVAVFAPKSVANRPQLALSGGIAAVVDTTTGVARTVATGVQVSYFNPACGPGDRALLTRGIGDDTGQVSDLLTVDAVAGKVVQTRHVAQQFTNPAPAADGDYGIAGGKLVKVGAAGKLTTVATPQGRAFGVQATANSGVDLVSVDGEQAVAQRFQGGRLTTTATGPRNGLQLFGLRGGKNALVGKVAMAGAAPTGLVTVAADRTVRALSGEGHLVAEEVVSRQTADSAAQPLAQADPAKRSGALLKVRAAGQATPVAADIATVPAPTLDVSLAAKTQTVTTLAAPATVTTPSCSVPRNNPSVQPLQPSPNQVEWAADMAVHGTFGTAGVRPDNYLKSGLSSYSPQGLFPRHSVVGGEFVPANLMLAILAQETNLSQASWHAVPGDTGNPLVALYYGSYANDVIDYSKSDCGYGIGQVTTGMSVAEGSTVYDSVQRTAIAIDYTANIAAGMNILIDKWNQIQNEPAVSRSHLNDDSPYYIQNWFLAVWAYNSGFYPYSARASHGGYYGVGWLNNPANPNYPAARDGFLRHSMADAETPSQWSYPERIMGWAETPQLKGGDAAYAKPDFGPNAPKFDRAEPAQSGITGLALPSKYAFCGTVNNCTSTSGCPAVNESCWWHGTATAGNCANGECASEHATYGQGAPEPELKRIYPKDCDDFPELDIPERDATRLTSYVYTLNNSAKYNLGCSGVGAQNGKFTILAGNPSGATDDAYYADVDLHQLGAGYKGHMWFTHGVTTSGTGITKHKIIGTWSPDLPLDPGERERYDIWIHMPSHGGTWHDAVYTLQRGSQLDNEVNETYPTCILDQDNSGAIYGHDRWVAFGNYDLGRGARLMLSNVGAPTSADVAFDAVAFVPTGDRNTYNYCRDEM